MSEGADVETQPASLWRLGFGLSALYLAQGIVHGGQGSLVRLAAARGESLEVQAGMLAYGALPWVLKLVWGIVQDRVLPRNARGHARVLVGLQLAVALALLPLAASSASHHVALLLFGLNLILSWQDVATDAFAVDHIPPTLRGRINGVMGGARAFGVSIIGSVVFMAALPVLGLGGVLYALTAGLALLGLAPLWLARARASERVATPPNHPREWLAGLRPMVVGICLLTMLGDGLSGAVSAQFLLGPAGWSVEALSNRLVPLATLAELLGFGLAAMLVDRLGPRVALAGGAAALGLTWAGLALAPSLWTVPELFYAVTIVEGLGRAFVLVGVYTLCMAGVGARARATQFLVYMALINLGTVLGTAAAPRVFDVGEFSGVWLVAAGLQLALVAASLMDTRTLDEPIN